jgi:hypothetical protein
MSAPNPDDPLAEAVARHWKENEQEAISMGARVRGRQGGDGARAVLGLRCSPPPRLANPRGPASTRPPPAREWTRLYAKP